MTLYDYYILKKKYSRLQNYNISPTPPNISAFFSTKAIILPIQPTIHSTCTKIGLEIIHYSPIKVTKII